jgi:hypothetical protein
MNQPACTGKGGVSGTGGASLGGQGGIADSPVVAVRLRCARRDAPLGIQTATPRLAWELESSDSKARGLSQSAYEVLVASSPDCAAGARDVQRARQQPLRKVHRVSRDNRPGRDFEHRASRRSGARSRLWSVRLFCAISGAAKPRAAAGHGLKVRRTVKFPL